MRRRLRRVAVGGLILFVGLVLWPRPHAAVPVGLQCQAPPAWPLSAAARALALSDQVPAASLSNPVGVHPEEGVWVIAGTRRGQTRVFRVEGASVLWSPTELSRRSSQARPAVRCLKARTSQEVGR
jgi:hypothetical protein